MKVIGIAGFSGSGKSELAEALVKKLRGDGKFVLLRPIADPIKEVAAGYFGWDWDKSLHKNSDGTTDKTRGRGILLAVGALGRKIDHLLWLKHWMRKLGQDRQRQPAPEIVLIDDIRCSNEVTYLRTQFNENFAVLKVLRPGVGPLDLFEPTEQGIPAPECNFIITNTSSPEALLQAALAELTPFLEKEG